MIFRRSGAILFAFILFILTLGLIPPVGRMLLEHYAFKPGVIQAIAGSQTPVAFQGLIFQEKALTSSDILPVYGSSEFSAESEFHPTKFYYGKPDGFVPFLMGRGGSQSLVHVLSLAAQGNTLHNKKVMVILSPQWFETGGITSQYLEQNFSPLQTYQILYDPSLSTGVKQQLSKRLLEFPEVVNKHPILAKNLAYHARKESSKQPLQILVNAAGRVEWWGLQVRDLYNTAMFIPLVNKHVIAQNAVNPVPKAPDWTALMKKAEKQGRESTDNNSWGILNSYYSKYIEPEFAQKAGSQSTERLYPSPEYQDLQLLMQVLQEQKAEAMFVIVPVNGFWYDYTGFSRQEREAYYTRIKKMIEQNGFESADFSQHEYDRYFLQDIMHLGWKGWLEVDQAMDQFYHQRA